MTASGRSKSSGRSSVPVPCVHYHFDSVFYYVSEMERATRFYRDMLGLKFISRDLVTRFDVDGVLFELIPATDRSKLEGSGNARLCLRVDNLEESLQELKAMGVPTTPAQNKGTGTLACIRDPDGNEICLWEYASDSYPPASHS